jgi:hypothetical protein
MHRDKLINPILMSRHVGNAYTADRCSVARVKLFHACAMWHALVQTCCCSAELFAWLENIVDFFSNTSSSPCDLCLTFWRCVVEFVRHIGSSVRKLLFDAYFPRWHVILKFNIITMKSLERSSEFL